ncbi:hypothetical protein BCR34DRAFT_538241 [Clohesyomyces aquaticus]|uniref:Uncharacterized protein n=1 Tax=Clohesyomyces aquaticus TaxID=1231657 RepID=A0A1Y1ZMS2_9PLEO|nr:hypothetical protein BCR34DRAFT_538241 [Clohesyomyces aquaticus]
MDSSTLLRQLLRSPRFYIHHLSAPARPSPTQFRTLALLSASARHVSTESLPRIVQPSFWTAVLPRFIRHPSTIFRSATQSKEWNPATPYIILSLLVGSQAIQTIWLKRDMQHFERRAEARLGILREVVERVQKGEDVDVEKVLGTGVEGEEKEWKEVIREVEEEEELFRSKKSRRAGRAAAAEKRKQKEEGEVESGARKEQGVQEAKVKVEAYNGAKFY